MKMKCLFLCLAGAFVSCSDTDECKEYDLKGEVKSSFAKFYGVEKKDGEWVKGNILYRHNRVIFDKKGLLQEVEHYNEHIFLTGKTIPTRKKGKIVEESYYDKDRDFVEKTIFKHISKNEIDFERFSSNGEKFRYGKTIRKNGKKTSKSTTFMYRDDEFREDIELFEYDKDDNLISVETTDEEGEITVSVRYEYLEFDAKGNWTKRLMFEIHHKHRDYRVSEPVCIETREIEYY